MLINLIWAQARNRIIGMNGIMPWHIPEDLAHFKATTQGHPVIMGRKTWESLPVKFRPLPNRKNIVLTRQPNWGADFNNPLIVKANSIESAISPQIVGANVNVVWVIGGAQIYEQYLSLASRVVITEIDAAFDGDTTAPTLGSEWIEANRVRNINQAGIKFDFVTYQKQSFQSTQLF
jgi:dihydrofolate reductase